MVYFEDARKKLTDYSRMPIKYKREKLEDMSLVDMQPGEKTENEQLAELIKPAIKNMPFLYDNTRMLQVQHLQEGGQKHIIPIYEQIILHLGI